LAGLEQRPGERRGAETSVAGKNIDVAERAHMDRIAEMKNRILTVQELASYLQVHPSTIYRMLKKNQLPAFRVGSDWRFRVEAIDKWRAALESGAPGSPERQRQSSN
jgi:excisionase family DNA binding protein